MVEIRSPLQGTVVRAAPVGIALAKRAEAIVIESMKMEHSIEVPEAGTIVELRVGAGDLVQKGDVLAVL
jgi:biotin carboxyl carrier protein